MARGGPAVSPLLCWWQPSLLILRKPWSCRDNNRDKGWKIFPSNFQEDGVLAGGWGAQGSAQGAWPRGGWGGGGGGGGRPQAVCWRAGLPGARAGFLGSRKLRALTIPK